MPHRFFISLYKNLLDTLFPWQCLNCHQETKNDWPLCDDCLKQINLNSEFVCPYCFKQITDWRKLHSFCRKKSYLSALGAVSSYQNNVLKETIHYFKYQKIINLINPLSCLLKEFLLDSFFFQNLVKDKKEEILVVPLPLHSKKKKERGFNQSELLALKISQFFNLNYNDKVLIRKINNPPQFSLKEINLRKENVKNIFEIQNKQLIQNKIVLLVDDVYTTGATLNEAAKTLKQNDAKKVIGVVLAKD
ncbi:MAG TPA: ComF family protein [Candidatus Paceibacterota bacterium]|nr:ComF family protein [Candidatus Paceibacterota bacterium]